MGKQVTLTNNEVANVRRGIMMIQNHPEVNLIVPLEFKLTRLFKSFDDVNEQYREKINNIRDKYAVKDEEGEFVLEDDKLTFKSEEDEKKFNDDLNELDEVENDVVLPVRLSADDFVDKHGHYLELPKELKGIMYLIDKVLV